MRRRMVAAAACAALQGCMTTQQLEDVAAAWAKIRGNQEQPEAPPTQATTSAEVPAAESLRPKESLLSDAGNAPAARPAPAPIPRTPPQASPRTAASIVLESYGEWSTRMNRTGWRALMCSLRAPGWQANLHLGLQRELPRRVAGARELATDKDAFDAYKDKALAWLRAAGEDNAQPSAADCNRLEFSEDLRIADQAVIRFLGQTGF